MRFSDNPSLIYPNWPAPKNVHAFSTTRLGGVSLPPYDSFNLGDHVNDDPAFILQNRQHLKKIANLPNDPIWLQQIHSTKVLDLSLPIVENISAPEADGSYSSMKNQVSIIMTADCLPVLFCSLDGNEVASAHAGWRGLCNGILEETVAHFSSPTNKIIAWLGPAIGPSQFEVGEDVRQAFIQLSALADNAFIPHPTNQDKYLADIYLLAKQRLNNIGITKIFGGTACTVSEPIHFFSFRRDKNTGRMASLIWFS